MYGEWMGENAIKISNITDKKEKAADEMFYELGYFKSNDDNFTIEYRNNKEDLHEINFYIKDKEVSKNFYREMGYITMKELQAINKKCEELGWI